MSPTPSLLSPCVTPALKLTTRTELAIDTGGSSVIPTITISDVEADKPSAESPVHTYHTKSNGDLPDTVPGDIPDGPVVIPDWYKVGWRAAGGIDNFTEDTARDKSILETFVAEQYYGEWYHSAALVFFVSGR